MLLAQAPPRDRPRDAVHDRRELAHLGLVSRDQAVEQRDRHRIGRDADRAPTFARVELHDRGAHLFRRVVVLERRLDREGLHARVRREHAVDRARRQSAAERHAADADDRQDRDAELALEGIETIERHERELHRREVAVVERRIRARDEHAHRIERLALHVLAHERVGREQMLAVLDERDHRHRRRREASEPGAHRPVVARQHGVLHARDEALVVLADAIEVARGRRHRVDELEDRRPLALVEGAGDVRMPGQAVQHLEHELRLGLLERGIGDTRREEHALADRMLGEEALVLREELLDDVFVDLLALEVPHLLVAPQMRERVVGLAHLVLGADRRSRGEERQRDVVGMLCAHRTGRAQGVRLALGRGGTDRFAHGWTLGRA